MTWDPPELTPSFWAQPKQRRLLCRSFWHHGFLVCLKKRHEGQTNTSDDGNRARTCQWQRNRQQGFIRGADMAAMCRLLQTARLQVAHSTVLNSTSCYLRASGLNFGTMDLPYPAIRTIIVILK